jgi:hypothetical protein
VVNDEMIPSRAHTGAASVATPPDSSSDHELERSATPLQSLHNLSPPSSATKPRSAAVEQILSVLRARFRGAPTANAYQEFALSPEDYIQLQYALEDEPELSTRFDYDSTDTGREFVLRMSAPLHCLTALKLQDEIHWALRAQAENAKEDRLHQLIGKIDAGGESGIYYEWTVEENDDEELRQKKIDRKHPDGQFRFEGAKYPPFVIEVAHSQNQKDLPVLADTYIRRSDAGTRTVLTIDLQYVAPSKTKVFPSPPHKAVYSIFRFREKNIDGQVKALVEADVENCAFRREDGQPEPGQLVLRISDFCPLEQVDRAVDHEITISHDAISKLVSKAERHQHDATAPVPPRRQRVWAAAKRKRSPPVSALADEDEMQFKVQEERAKKKAEAEDPPFEAGSSFDAVLERYEAAPDEARERKKRLRPHRTGSDPGLDR